MAEGSILPSLIDSAEAVIACTPCSEDNIREEAVKYCPECQEYVCATCARCHSRQKATRAHGLVNKNEAKQCFDVKEAMKCLNHPDKDVEMYCQTHDMVYCTMCIATTHRSCSGVDKITDALLTSNDEQNDMKQFQQKVIISLERLIDMNSTNNGFIDSIESEKTDIRSRIENNIMEHVAKLKTEVDTALDKVHTEIKDELLGDIDKVTQIIAILKKKEALLQAVSSMEDTEAVQRFALMKQVQKTLNDAKKIHEDHELHRRNTVLLKENVILKSALIASDFGQIFSVAGDAPMQKHAQYSTRKIEVSKMKLQRNLRRVRVNAICVLKNGTIILADNANKVLWLDKYVKLKDCCNLGASPLSICCTAHNEIAVKTKTGIIQFLSAEKNLVKTKKIYLEMPDGFRPGLVQCGGELWVSAPKSINVYSASGCLLRPFKGDTSYFTTMDTIGETVIVTGFDGIGGAVCLTKDGARTELRDGRLGEYCCVCVSPDGIIFLSGKSLKNIFLMFSADGKCLGECGTNEALLEDLRLISYNNKDNCIVAVCFGVFLFLSLQRPGYDRYSIEAGY